MTAKERVMAVLNFEQADYMPFHTSFWPEFTAAWNAARPAGDDTLITDYYPQDIEIAVGDEAPYPTRAQTLYTDGEYEIQRDGWGRTIRVKPNAYFMHQIDGAYDASGNLKHGDFDPVDLPERYAYLDSAMQTLKEQYCVFAKVGGPFIRTYFMTGAIELLMNMAGDSKLAREQVMRTARHLTEIGLEELRRWDLYDTGIWIFDDMASTENPMFSPTTALDIMAPAWGYMADAFRAAGAKKIIMHSDGNIGPLLDLFIDLGFDGINPVEYKAGLDAVKLHEKYGERLALIGGLSNGLILPAGDPAQVREHVLRIMAAGRDGGLVLGTHSVGPDISLETWELVWQTYLEYRDFPLSMPV